MTDPYRVLGVTRNSSDEEIKQAYRKLAKQHHPDRGGDQDKFKQVNAAYDQIKDKDSRQSFEQPQQSGGNPFNDMNMNDIFSQFDNQFNFNFRQPKNKDITITYNISLEELLSGVNKDITIHISRSKTKTVNIQIPAGVPNGSKIKFSRCGDDTNQQLPPGDLYVTVLEQKHPIYTRIDNNCLVKETIFVKDAILGKSIEVSGIDKKKYSVKIKPGTQPGTKLRIPEAGFPIYGTRKTGDLIIQINVSIPASTDPDTKIKDL